MKQTGYPNGRPGYVVDHKVPLKRGGRDDPSNMQWQTVEAAKQRISGSNKRGIGEGIHRHTTQFIGPNVLWW